MSRDTFKAKGTPPNDTVKGIAFTQQERNFCIDALNEHLLHWRRKDMLTKDEIEDNREKLAEEVKVLEQLIDDFKGPSWENKDD